ncbi:CUB domain-containing protein 2-like, partial [Anneissia japonica]|uniref:CUB domain-containing protein 2-like n=1 Tax=Anneissia japonica TaxID=1529436 RepID=UPI0014255BA4
MVECVHTILTASSGSFSSPGFPMLYRNNIDCKYTIVTSPDRVIIIIFHTLQLELDPECSHDYVELINYPESSGERLCNQIGTTSEIWTSTSNQVVINFHSDGSWVNTGFNATYSTIIKASNPTEAPQTTVVPCHLKKLSGNFDVLISPGFPEEYPSNHYCQTLITVSEKHKVVITL